MNIALLSSLNPRNLHDGEPVDVGLLLEDDGPGALLEVTGSGEPELARRILHPAVDDTELAPLLQHASAEVRASHAIPDTSQTRRGRCEFSDGGTQGARATGRIY